MNVIGFQVWFDWDFGAESPVNILVLCVFVDFDIKASQVKGFGIKSLNHRVEYQ